MDVGDVTVWYGPTYVGDLGGEKIEHTGVYTGEYGDMLELYGI